MMSSMSRGRFSAILATSLVFALMLAAVPASGATAPVARTRSAAPGVRVAPERTTASGIRPLAADDDMPGVPITPSPITGTLNAASDVDDVFAVELADGDTLSATISGPAGTNFDLFLYPPGASTVASVAPVASNADLRDFVYPYTLDFRVDAAGGYTPGTYYLDAWSGGTSGTYAITWRIIPADNNNDIAFAQPIPASPFVGWNSFAVNGGILDVSPGSGDYWTSSFPDVFVDGFDVYSVDLAEGDQFTATVKSTDKDLDMELLLYPPHASMVDTDGIVQYEDAWASASDLTKIGLPETVHFIVPPGGRGTYYLSAEAWRGNGDYSLTWAVNKDNLVRMQGASRYSTGLSIVRGTTYQSQYAIIASGANYPDALSAAGVAGAYEAPLLLTNPKTLLDDLKVQLVELGVTDVIVIGGTAAVSGGVFTALEDMGFDSVERLAGTDRYATSAKCAARVAQITGTVDGAFVVRGDSFPDALAVAPFAYTQAMPVLLTRPTSLPGSIASFLDVNNVPNVYIAGGTNVVSSGVAGSLDRLNGGATVVERIAGSDRYHTARKVADFGVAKGWGTYAFVGVATGANFPDALAGGVACGRMGGVLLLTKPSALSSWCGGAIGANAGTVDRVAVFGSSSAVSAGVYNSINAILP
ncbi:MAG: cell wall-binding repeat-containing protein [Actinobacteria bacterium]|nr:MAG: cell wall-binding repeat-containing protein [Actinomycetota bacterium]